MTLLAIKESLRAAVASTGYKVYATVPDRLTPPVIIMQGQTPYIEDTDESFTRKQMLVHLTLTYVSGKIGEAAIPDIDQALNAMIQAIPGSWTLNVGAPYAANVKDKIYGACDISVSNIYNLID